MKPPKLTLVSKATLEEHSIERQYLHLQLAKLTDTLRQISTSRPIELEPPDMDHEPAFNPVPSRHESGEATVRRLLSMRRRLEQFPETTSIQEGASGLFHLGLALLHQDMAAESILSLSWAADLYKTLARGHETFFAYLALAFHNLSVTHSYRGGHVDAQKSLKASEDALKAVGVLMDMRPSHDYRSLYGTILVRKARALMGLNSYEEAKPPLRHAHELCRQLLPDFLAVQQTPLPEGLVEEVLLMLDFGARACVELAECMSKLGEPAENVFTTVLESMEFYAYIPEQPLPWANLSRLGHAHGDEILCHFEVLYRNGKRKVDDFLPLLEAFRALATKHPVVFAITFVQHCLVFVRLSLDQGPGDDPFPYNYSPVGGALPPGSVIPRNVLDYVQSHGDAEFAKELFRAYFVYSPNFYHIGENAGASMIFTFLNNYSDSAMLVLRQITASLTYASTAKAADWVAIHAVLSRISKTVETIPASDPLRESILELCREVVEYHKLDPLKIELARVLRIYAGVLITCEKLDMALVSIEQCLTLSKNETSKHLLYLYPTALRMKATILSRNGNFTTAIKLCQESVTSWEAIERRSADANAGLNIFELLGDLSAYASSTGDTVLQATTLAKMNIRTQTGTSAPPSDPNILSTTSSGITEVLVVPSTSEVTEQGSLVEVAASDKDSEATLVDGDLPADMAAEPPVVDLSPLPKDTSLPSSPDDLSTLSDRFLNHSHPFLVVFHVFVASLSLWLGWIHLPIRQILAFIAAALVILYPVFVVWTIFFRRQRRV